MAGIATRIFLFTLILSLMLRLMSPYGLTTSSAAQSYYEIQAEALNVDSANSILNQITGSISNNIPAAAITAVGIIFGNYLLAFAGIATIILNTLVLPQSLINELGAVPFGIGSLFSNIISFLYAVAILSWFSGGRDL